MERIRRIIHRSDNVRCNIATGGKTIRFHSFISDGNLFLFAVCCCCCCCCYCCNGVASPFQFLGISKNQILISTLISFICSSASKRRGLLRLFHDETRTFKRWAKETMFLSWFFLLEGRARSKRWRPGRLRRVNAIVTNRWRNSWRRDHTARSRLSLLTIFSLLQEINNSSAALPLFLPLFLSLLLSLFLSLFLSLLLQLVDGSTN